MNQLNIRRIQIDRMYKPSSFERPIDASGLQAGINIIYGKNARGKSTIARVIRQVVWKSDLDRYARGAVDLELGARHWELDLDGEVIGALKDGSEVPWVWSWQTELSDAYHLSITSLMSTNGSDFATRLQRAASGGYDVREGAADLEFSDSIPTRRVSDVTRLESAATEVRDKKLEYDSLRSDQEQMTELRNRLEEARRQEGETELIRRAIEWRKGEDEFSGIKDEVDSYPEFLENVVGDELDELLRIRSSVSDRRSTREARSRLIVSAESDLEALALPASGFIREDQIDLDASIGDIEVARKELLSAESSANSARDLAAKLWQKVEGGIDRDRASNLSTDELRSALDLAVKTTALRSLIDTLNVKLESLPESDPASIEEQAAETRDGIRQLTLWLETGSTTQADPLPRRLVFLSAILLAAVSIVLGLILSPALLALLLLSLLLAYAGKKIYVGESQEVTREARQKDFDRLALPGLQEWNRERVIDHLSDLVKRLTTLHEELDGVQRRSHLKQDQIKANDETRRLRENGMELAGKSGINPADSPEASLLLKSLIDWISAEHELAAQTLNSEELARRIEHSLEEGNQVLSKYGLTPATEFTELNARSRSLKIKEDKRIKLRDGLTAARSETETLDRELREFEATEERLLKRLQLSEFDEITVAALVKDAGLRRTAVDKLRIRQREQETRRGQIVERGGEHLLSMSLEDLNTAFDRAEQEASEVEKLRNRLSDIKAMVDQAEKRTDLAAAMKEEAEAETGLRDLREKIYVKRVGFELSRWVEEKSRREDRPEVLKNASQLLHRITQGRYSIELNSEGFVLRDAEEGWIQSLGELSFGTQIQMMIAVRVAFLRHLEGEHGIRLPLLVDEALATSDDQRAGEIIAALQEIAAERQVIYFTAQRDEVEKFRQLAGPEEINVVDLEDGAFRQVEPAERPVAPDAIPDPGDRTLSEYRDQISVPPWGGRSKHTSLHLWYLADSPGVLYRMMLRGYRTWGPFESMDHESPGVLSEFPASEIARIKARGRAAKTWQSLWERGRGQQLTRQALIESGAVSDTFIDRIASLCADLDWDARALMRAFEIREDDRTTGFRIDKVDLLREFSLEKRYLVETDPLTPDALLRELMESVMKDFREVGLEVSDLHNLLGRLASGESG